MPEFYENLVTAFEERCEDNLTKKLVQCEKFEQRKEKKSELERERTKVLKNTYIVLKMSKKLLTVQICRQNEKLGRL